jgi:hypothetical protein
MSRTSKPADGNKPRTDKPAETRKRRAGKPARRGLASLPTGHGDLGQSLLYIFPLFLIYELGVMFTSPRNGVDFVTRLIARAVGYDQRRYLIVHLVLAAGFLTAVLVLRRKRMFSFRAALPMLAESAIYALTLGSFIVFVMENLLGGVLAVAGLQLAGQLGHGLSLQLGHTGEQLVMAIGAGVHEELVFRLGLLSGGAWLLERVGLGRGAAVIIAGVVSSLVFSAAHHLGPLGDPFSLDVFVYRSMAGAIFAAIFYFRSLSHAVYTHFLYDVYVMLLRS